MTLAASQWPDSIDATATLVFLAVVVGLPALGYVFLIADFRAYLRSLRGALIRVVHYFPEMPEWARLQTPRCMVALGVQMPCTEQDVKKAYRKKVKTLHPDRGGDRRRFLVLQSHFEEALRYLSERSPG